MERDIIGEMRVLQIMYNTCVLKMNALIKKELNKKEEEKMYLWEDKLGSILQEKGEYKRNRDREFVNKILYGE